MKNKMRPIHPGEILKEELETIGLSANAFAKRLRVPANRISAILGERRGVTADTAMRLARFFGTTPEFWLNLQRDYDLKTTMKMSGKKIMQDIEPHQRAA